MNENSFKVRNSNSIASYTIIKHTYKFYLFYLDNRDKLFVKFLNITICVRINSFMFIELMQFFLSFLADFPKYFP